MDDDEVMSLLQVMQPVIWRCVCPSQRSLLWFFYVSFGDPQLVQSRLAYALMLAQLCFAEYQ